MSCTVGLDQVAPLSVETERETWWIFDCEKACVTVVLPDDSTGSPPSSKSHRSLTLPLAPPNGVKTKSTPFTAPQKGTVNSGAFWSSS